MSVTKLKAWMKQHGKTEVDVASATGFAPVTIWRYLKGKSVNRSTELALQRLIKAHHAENEKAEVETA